MVPILGFISNVVEDFVGHEGRHGPTNLMKARNSSLLNSQKFVSVSNQFGIHEKTLIGTLQKVADVAVVLSEA